MIMNMLVYMITVLNGPEKAAVILSEVAEIMIPERVNDYIKEHLNAG
jgi:hypothetical protein